MTLSSSVKKAASELGFNLVGITSIDSPETKEALTRAMKRYDDWIAAGFGASMDYLRRHAALKAEPEDLLPSLRSVVCVGLSYGEDEPTDDGTQAKVSLYTRGKDYHQVLGSKLAALAEILKVNYAIQSRAFVDSEPVLERFWAWRSGLGWLGKNTMLIHRKLGSYLFLGGLLTTADLESDTPQPDHCGRCRKCIDACPTQAITDLRQVDSNKCIAYHTIENRSSVPQFVMEKSGRWIAGCDICQTTCPWNDPISKQELFSNENIAYNSPLNELTQWSSEDFKERTQGIAMSRMKYTGFLRNVTVALANSDLRREEKIKAIANLETRVQGLSLGAGRDGALDALRWAKGKIDYDR